MGDFEPLIRTINLAGLQVRFLLATPQAREWYDPMKPHALAEFEWVREHIPLRDQRIIDAGAHHGLYTCFFGLASDRRSEIVAIDAMPSNCALVEANTALNKLTVEIRNCAVSDQRGKVSFKPVSNGHITRSGEAGTVEVDSIYLTDVMKNPTVVKLDVEGAEFYILPKQLKKLSSVQHWIIEVHPSPNRNPHELMQFLKVNGLSLKWLNRANNRIEDYPVNADWSLHTTVFATR